TSTWTNLISPSVLSVSSSTAQVGWVAFNSGSSTNTAQGYELDYSTSNNFITYQSSVTTAVTVSTLTASGLTAYTTYYLRAGAINWDGVVNYASALSTVTLTGPAPVVTSINVFVTSATVNYTLTAGSGGYELDVSSNNFGAGVIFSSVTTSAALGSLTILSGLNPDTTYQFKVGSLWNGATDYAATLSTSTWTSLLQNAQVYAISQTSITLNWQPFTYGSGANKAIGYLVQASTWSDFRSIDGSSVTYDVTFSTLTVQNLNISTPYYFR